MREKFTHACNSNMLINLAKHGKKKNSFGMAVAEIEAEGDGRALLAVEDSACCSQQRRDCWHESEFSTLL
jgi:hypothetical protein